MFSSFLCLLVLHHMSVVCSNVSWDARVFYRSIHGSTLHQQLSYINIIFYLLILMYYTQNLYTRLYIIVTVSTQFILYVNSIAILNIQMYLLHQPLQGPVWPQQEHTLASQTLYCEDVPSIYITSSLAASIAAPYNQYGFHNKSVKGSIFVYLTLFDTNI